jgi:hypothetical protein
VCGTVSAAVSPSTNPMAKPPSGTSQVRSRPCTSDTNAHTPLCAAIGSAWMLGTWSLDTTVI